MVENIKYEIALCDDSTEWLDDLEEKILSIMGDKCNINKFVLPERLIDFIVNNHVDILITDISMPGKDGIELAQILRENTTNLQIIFVTAYDYIEKVFKVKPVYYLEKPVKIKNLQEALRIAVDNIEGRGFITVTDQKKTFRICTDDIIYIESYQRKVHIFTEKEVYESFLKLDDLVDELPVNFVRSHKSFIVNMDKIKRVSNNQIETCNNVITPVPKAKYTAVKEEILNYWEFSKENKKS